jgi:hypothetical protein
VRQGMIWWGRLLCHRGSGTAVSNYGTRQSQASSTVMVTLSTQSSLPQLVSHTAPEINPTVKTMCTRLQKTHTTGPSAAAVSSGAVCGRQLQDQQCSPLGPAGSSCSHSSSRGQG